MKSESRRVTSRTAKFVAKPIRNASAKLSRTPARGVFRLVELAQDRFLVDARQEVQAGVGARTSRSASSSSINHYISGRGRVTPDLRGPRSGET